MGRQTEAGCTALQHSVRGSHFFCACRQRARARVWAKVASKQSKPLA